MPVYDFTCQAGHEFTKRAGYTDEVAPCACGEPARRAAFYRPNFIVAGQTLPDEPDVKSIQQEWFGEVKKRGWTGERAVEGLRKSVVEDKEGRRFIDTSKMPKESQ
jgi:hypothetical protein